MAFLFTLLRENKGHAAAYFILFAMGVSGYTSLLLELGELRASSKFQLQVIDRLVDDIDRCEQGEPHGVHPH